MSNKFENYSAEEFMKLCFADDSGKEGHKFWENFAKLRVDVWEKDCPKIYNYKNSYDALPDPDVNSYNLYEAHIRVWNIQHKKFKNNKDENPLKDIKRNGRCRCEIIIKDEKKTKDDKIILGSDSIMNIYWHRTYGNIPNIMENVKNTSLNDKIEELEKKLKEIGIGKDEREKMRCYSTMSQNEHFSLYKKFIWYYLQYANTIGGFMLFPRHDCSINQARGMSDRIQDRFDLTLECIRRMYERGFPTGSNPLFDMSKEDKKFFRMFGSFENYAKFFCLNKSYDGKHNWVTEDCSAVYDLMSENVDEPLPKKGWPTEILPCDYKSKEKIAKWWTFYRNIMNRLDARNRQIKEVIEKSL